MKPLEEGTPTQTEPYASSPTIGCADPMPDCESGSHAELAPLGAHELSCANESVHSGSTLPGLSDVHRSDRFLREAVPVQAQLFRRALWMTRSHADAEDLLQDTMVNAYRSFHSFQRDTNLIAWLNRIMTNVYINTYRKTKRQPMSLSIDQCSDALLAAHSRHPGAGASAEDQALDGMLNFALATAMRSLPETLRIAIYYADVEGLSYKQIAEITGVKRGTVMSRLHRGRSRLRTLLTDDIHSEARSANP
jgi:RNA polymerase sigma-70 factor, ECF subfamily